MVKYLLIKYFSYSLFIFVFLAGISLFNISLGMFTQSFLIGGTAGVFVTHKYFSLLNYWVLFSNLKINRYKYMGAFYSIYLISLFLIILLLREAIAGF